MTALGHRHPKLSKSGTAEIRARADLPFEREEGLKRVESRRSTSIPRTAGFGATWPFATGLAKVGNPYPMQSFTR
jgi:hypothetical protein